MDIYNLPTKLWEGNVFTGDCHSVQGCACLVPGPFWGGYDWSYVPSGDVHTSSHVLFKGWVSLDLVLFLGLGGGIPRGGYTKGWVCPGLWVYQRGSGWVGIYTHFHQTWYLGYLSSWYWPPQHIWLESRQYTSYWNAF